MSSKKKSNHLKGLFSAARKQGKLSAQSMKSLDIVDLGGLAVAFRSRHGTAHLPDHRPHGSLGPGDQLCRAKRPVPEPRGLADDWVSWYRRRGTRHAILLFRSTSHTPCRSAGIRRLARYPRFKPNRRCSLQPARESTRRACFQSSRDLSTPCNDATILIPSVASDSRISTLAWKHCRP